jgi:integrase
MSPRARVREKRLQTPRFRAIDQSKAALTARTHPSRYPISPEHGRSRVPPEEPHPFQSGSARLLPRLIGDRDRGPIFLADRRPGPARTPASLDLCPVTGRGRLSYERSAYLFKQHSLNASTTSWTLHQLRHSALTHLAEDGVNLPLLMAKSGHENLRSLQKYARPGAEAVAAMTAAHDPARRRR